MDVYTYGINILWLEGFLSPEDSSRIAFFINLNTLKYTHTHVIGEKVQIGHLNSAVC